MIPRAPRFTEAQLAELSASEARALSHDEFEARVRAPWSAQEIEDFESLVGWFRRRYPTGGARLAAIRNRMDQLRRGRR